MELYLLRHAESIKGAGLSLGTTSRNSGLTENGKRKSQEWQSQ